VNFAPTSWHFSNIIDTFSRPRIRAVQEEPLLCLGLLSSDFEPATTVSADKSSQSSTMPSRSEGPGCLFYLILRQSETFQQQGDISANPSFVLNILPCKQGVGHQESRAKHNNHVRACDINMENRCIEIESDHSNIPRI
jgi:hypothetical protein